MTKSMSGGRWRIAAAGAILLAIPLAAACSQEPSTGEGGGDLSELEIQFPEMWSAYDGTHDFVVPAIIPGVKKVKWTVSPANAATVDAQDDGQVLLKLKKAGELKVTAKVGSLSATVKLHVTEATADDWADGEARYNSGVIVAARPDGGWHNADGGGGSKFKDPTLACTNCHVEGGKGVANGDVKHTPVQTAGYSDEDLENIITKAQKPDGVKMRTGISREKWAKFHKWQMTPEQLKGIIVYLRSLAPEAQGELDFGGHGGWGGGGDKHQDEKNKEKDAPAEAGASTVQ